MVNSIDSHLIIGLWITSFIVFMGLVISLRQNKFRLLNGALANIWLINLGVAIILSAEKSQIHWLYLFVYYLVAIITIPLIAIYSVLGILLLWNAAIVWKKESHTLANTLTLILGIILIAFPIVENLLKNFFPSWMIVVYQAMVTPVAIYIAFWFLAFITSFFITRLYKPSYDKDYIIILGAGLYDGDQVTPLLASRIEAALTFAQKQFKKNGKYPLLICSGGQGIDETIPEGAAMKKYALGKGAPPDKIISEENSRTTYENMQFSKAILTEKQLNISKGLFSTSDYHTFRAAGYARYVGLEIDGLGAKTTRFFIPNAFLREYIALLVNHKYFHISCISILWLLELLNLFLLYTNG